MDIAQGLAMHRNEVMKYLEELVEQRQVGARNTGSRIYYCGKHNVTTVKEGNAV